MGKKKSKDEANQDLTDTTRLDLISVLDAKAELSHCVDCADDVEHDCPQDKLQDAPVPDGARPDSPGGRTEGQTYRKMISAVASKPKGVRKYFRIRSRY